MAMTRRGSGILLMVGVMGLLPAVPAGAAEACGEGAVTEICGETILRGSTAGRQTVRLAQAASVSPSAVEISGSGDYVGWAIRGIEGSPTEGIFLVDGLLPESHAAVADQRRQTFDWGTSACGDPCALPAGWYTVALLADGSPVEVRLAFEGLSGTTTLSPAEPLDYRAKALDVAVNAGPGNMVQSAGEYHAPSGPGMAFVALTVRSEEWRVGAYGVCWVSDGDGGTMMPVAFLPGCPDRQFAGGQEGAYAFTAVTHSFSPHDPGPFAVRVVAATPTRSDHFGLGVWYAMAGEAVGSGGTGVWLGMS